MKKKILPIIMFILLLCGMAFFPYIPMKLFNINYEGFSQSAKIIYSLICDILYMGIIFIIYRKEITDNFKSYFKKFGDNMELSFKYYLVGFIIMVISNLVITFFVKDATATNEEAVRDLISLYPMYMIFSVSIYAPFVEEMIFRKSVRDAVLAFGDNKFMKYLYAFISGFIFALMHIVGTSSNIIDFVYIIPYLSLGCAFALLYNKSNNIFSSICMHAMHNTIAIVLYLVSGVV